MSFWRGKRILVTGVNGFIGGNLARFFIQTGADVTGLERNIDRRSLLHFEGFTSHLRLVRGDLCDGAFLERVVAEGNFDYCFHLAAQVEIGVGLQSPYTTFETNIRGTYTMLEALRLHAPSLSAVVVASTDKAYGEYPSDLMPYRENYPLLPRYPYDTSKACADLIAQSYANEVFKLPIVVTRFCNIYGPGQLNFSALIPDAVRAALGYGTFIPRGNGSHVRDFIFVDDVVSLYANIAERTGRQSELLRGRVYNAGTNEPRSVRDVVERIFTHCGAHQALDVVLEQMKRAETTGEISTQFMDFDTVERDFGWRPTTTFDDGLTTTIQWFRRFLASQTL